MSYRYLPELKRLALALTLVLAVVSGCATTGQQGDTGASQPAAPNLERAREAYVQKDYTLAAHLLEQLAREGDPVAQYALGYMHYYGQGMPRDPELAMVWIRRAADKGYEKANDALLRFAARPKQDGVDDGWTEERGSGEIEELLTAPPQEQP